jgi:hypothetical protein
MKWKFSTLKTMVGLNTYKRCGRYILGLGRGGELKVLLMDL